MPRGKRIVGPRMAINTSVFKNLPAEERLRLLVSSVVESGGFPESGNGENFKRRLENARRVFRNN